MGVGYRNQEGYADPVPYLAISNMNVQYYPSCLQTCRNKSAADNRRCGRNVSSNHRRQECSQSRKIH